MEEPVYAISATSLEVIGGIIGVLTGAVSFLGRMLLKNKDRELDDLTKDRDYWRERAMRHLERDSESAETSSS